MRHVNERGLDGAEGFHLHCYKIELPGSEVGRTVGTAGLGLC